MGFKLKIQNTKLKTLVGSRLLFFVPESPFVLPAYPISLTAFSKGFAF